MVLWGLGGSGSSVAGLCLELDRYRQLQDEMLLLGQQPWAQLEAFHRSNKLTGVVRRNIAVLFLDNMA